MAKKKVKKKDPFAKAKANPGTPAGVRKAIAERETLRKKRKPKPKKPTLFSKIKSRKPPKAVAEIGEGAFKAISRVLKSQKKPRKS